MKTLAVVDSKGNIHHIGKWDVKDAKGNPVEIPAGLTEGEFDIAKTVDGGYVLATDHKKLRQAEYPSIGDQLDSLYAAGLFPVEMAEKIKRVKDKYPKVVK